MKDLKLHGELPLHTVQVLKFSFGGHLLAATQGKLIHIFSVTTLTKARLLDEKPRVAKQFWWFCMEFTADCFVKKQIQSNSQAGGKEIGCFGSWPAFEGDNSARAHAGCFKHQLRSRGQTQLGAETAEPNSFEDHTLWSVGDEGKLIVWNLNTFEPDATRTEA